MKKTTILAIAIAILGLVWIFAVTAFTMLFDLPWMCLGSLTCTAIAIIAAEIYLLLIKKDPGKQGAEPGAIGSIITVSFLLVTVLLNTVFVLLGCGDFNWVLLTLNLLAIACYIIALLCVEHSTARLSEQLVKTEQKTAPSKEVARKLGELLAVTEDAEIKAKLLKLKEAVDYGTNISTYATAAREEQMIVLLDEIVQLTFGRADRMIILNKVESAEMIWKMRSSTASSAR